MNDSCKQRLFEKKVDNRTVLVIVSIIFDIISFIFILVLISYQFYLNCYRIDQFYSSFSFELLPVPKKICWIFNENATYQVLISFYSIIKSNPDQNFDFYFIIPPNETINTTYFSFFYETWL